MSKKTSSGGLHAIVSTLKHAHQRTGLRRSFKALLTMNQTDGFDCPGCAWPEPKHRSAFEFCENGAKTLMNATTTKMIDHAFITEHSLADLGTWSEYQLANCGRIVTPILKSPGQSHFAPISFADAYALAAENLATLSSPDRAVFYTSGRASNEAAFLYQLFARMLGTNNLCDCSNLCHESSGVALKNTIGVGKGTVQIDDFLSAQVIFLIGHNPSSNHPRMLTTLKEARMRGARIVVINPLIEPGLKAFRHPQKIGDLLGPAQEIATDYFQVKVGGDYALFLAIAYDMIHHDRWPADMLDTDFIGHYTEGFFDYKNYLAGFSFDDLVAQTGLTREEVQSISSLIAKSSRVIYAWGMGITQTTYGVFAIEAIVSLALLKGHIGKAGAGLCPVRGHSNVQGNRTVGINEKPDVAFLKRLGEVFSFAPPQHHGHDVVSAIHAMERQEVDIFMALGGNFVSAGPDSKRLEEAASHVSFALHIGTSLNRTHLTLGKTALLLPCLTRVEKDIRHGIAQVVSVENSMSIVHTSRGNFLPIKPDIPSEVAIIAEIASRSLSNKSVNFIDLSNDYRLIRTLMSRVFDDFYDYNERLNHKDGFILKNKASQRVFATKANKALFAIGEKPASLGPSAPFLLTTIRSHDQFNTAIYGLNDRLRGIVGQRMVVFMNQEDMLELGVKENQTIALSSNFNGHIRTLSGLFIKPYAIKKGCIATYFPEGNALIPLESVALLSNTPTSKLIPVNIHIA